MPELRVATHVLEAMRSVDEGRVYSLAHSLSSDIPHLCDSPAPAGDRFTMQMGVFEFPDQPMKCFGETMSFYAHTGTHIDALGHWSRRGHSFSGIDADENFTPDGLKQLGIDEVPPLIGRGMLIDLAGYKTVDSLEAGEAIYPEDLEGALSSQGCEIHTGDIVLFRTGWARHWNDRRKYMSACPGLVEEAAAWLSDRGCVAIGADQWDVDVVPAAAPDKQLAVHALCLAERGIYLIENLWLDELAADGVYEFCCIALVAPVRGATGFPVQVVAVT